LRISGVEDGCLRKGVTVEMGRMVRVIYEGCGRVRLRGVDVVGVYGISRTKGQGSAKFGTLHSLTFGMFKM
jgi:hypothetical protein